MIKYIYLNCQYKIFNNVHNSFREILEKDHICLQQEHSVTLNFIQNFITGIVVGDGIFTKVPGVKLAISAHDCLPLIIYHETFVGLVHIGWQGLNLGILDNVFKLFNKENIPIEKLNFIIGPHITVKTMEYKEEDLWKKKKLYSKKYFPEKNGKKYFDITNFVQDTLKSYKIREDQITLSCIDTYSNNNYASFRRNGLNSSLTNFFTIEILTR